MAISTAAGIVGGAVVSGIGSIIGGNSQKKAINRATDAATENNERSIALQREIYGNNRMTLDPYIQRGNRAGEQMNALLGLGGARPTASALPPTMQGQALPASLYGPNPGAALPPPYTGGPITRQDLINGVSPQTVFNQRLGAQGYTIRTLPNGQSYIDEGEGFAGYRPVGANFAPASTAPPSALSAREAAEDAFDIFRDSTGYRFRFDQGRDALDTSAAARGLLRSGPQMRALTEYGQGVASDEFARYMGYLGNQQGVGFSGASALAGVGQNFANATSNLNSQNASILGNAALARGNANANMWNGLASSFGTALGAFK